MCGSPVCRSEFQFSEAQKGCRVSDDTDLRNIVADIAAAYFRKNYVAPSVIPTVINQIASSLAAVDAPVMQTSPDAPPRPKLSPSQIRKSVGHDALISFEDSKPYKTLRRHLAARGLSPEEYRGKWGLPADYPMIAPSYREARASLAKARGFGARAALNAASPEPAADVARPAPESNVAPPEPGTENFPAVAATKPSLRGLGLSRKSASAPTAFRPRDAVRDPETSARHKRWLAMLSETDWGRIRAIARQVNHAHVPPALTDLTAPLRVRMCPAGQEARFPGEHVGTLRGGQVAVLISERGEP